MDILGFIAWKGIGACKLFASLPFVRKKTGGIAISSSMGYDRISPSGYDKNKGDYTRYRGLELIAEQITKNNIVGSVAELGVFRGDFSSEINRLFPDKTLYLFDTFEGFADSDVNYDNENDYASKEVVESANYFRDTNVDLVLKRMPHQEKCVVRKGYFPETTEGLEDKFALVSIDCDLYMPILAGLKYFYPRLVSGGYIMLHDYNQIGYGKGVSAAVDDFEKEFGRVCKVPLTDCCGSLVIYKN